MPKLYTSPFSVIFPVSMYSANTTQTLANQVLIEEISWHASQVAKMQRIDELLYGRQRSYLEVNTQEFLPP